MVQKSAILTFPKQFVDKPIISRLIRNYDVEINILQATITQEEDGRMFAVFSGTNEAVDEVFQYLRQEQVQIVFPARNLQWDETLCVHCGACVGQCSFEALSKDDTTHMVQFDEDRCRACELCVSACSYNAIATQDQFSRRGDNKKRRIGAK